MWIITNNISILIIPLWILKMLIHHILLIKEGTAMKPGRDYTPVINRGFCCLTNESAFITFLIGLKGLPALTRHRVVACHTQLGILRIISGLPLLILLSITIYSNCTLSSNGVTWSQGGQGKLPVTLFGPWIRPLAIAEPGFGLVLCHVAHQCRDLHIESQLQFMAGSSSA